MRVYTVPHLAKALGLPLDVVKSFLADVPPAFTSNHGGKGLTKFYTDEIFSRAHEIRAYAQERNTRRVETCRRNASKGREVAVRKAQTRAATLESRIRDLESRLAQLAA